MSRLSTLSFLFFMALVSACHGAPSAPEALPDPPANPAPSAGAAAPLDAAGFEYTTFATLTREPTLAEVEARARRAFLALDAHEEQEVCDWLALELRGEQSFQLSLIRYMLASSEVSEGLWPESAAPRWFDPATHAPLQPIARHLLSPDEAGVRAVRGQIFGNVAPRRLISAWQYDYATRGIVRLADAYDPRRLFENALCGLPPGWDLAEALVERALDDGSLQKSFEAFAHAYTDREGGVYPGVTLYDAWASRTQIEMPDVDNLGIVHGILDDWETWRAPLPSEQQPELYGRIAELFQAAHHHRSLRHNLARAYLCGSTELRDGYQHNLERFHALWESASSDPWQLVPRLPDPAGWTAFLEDWSRQLEADPALFLKGVNRHYTLDGDAQLVRQKLLWVLEQYGAYERLAAR